MVTTEKVTIWMLLWAIYMKDHNPRARWTYTPYCQGEYTDGSLYNPCGVCYICNKIWDRNDQTTINDCSLFPKGWLTLEHEPFHRVSSVPEGGFCKPVSFCFDKCSCENARTNANGEPECVNLIGTCKCGCNETRYGQECEHVIPPELSIDSFADIQTIMYTPYVYAGDFATLAIYIYITGINLKLEIRTEREFLIYNADSCKTNAPSVQDYCVEIFEEAQAGDYMDVCQGGPTYNKHHNNLVCAVIVNLAFPHIQLNPLNENKFSFNYQKEKEFPNRTIVAKEEIIEIKVFNSISKLSGTPIIFSHKFGIAVFYTGKSPIESCPPIVTIYKYAKTMFNVPSFSRRKVIALASSVIPNEGPECEDLGDPVLDWFVWIVNLNHDEKNDPPFAARLQTTDTMFEPFSLKYGLYKVKLMITFVGRHFNEKIAYCYFKIIPIPLQPTIIGGSLRYIYYKNDLELITAAVSDPNLPRDHQPKMNYTWYCNDTDQVCKKVTTDHFIWTVDGPFTVGKYYNFTMKVFSSLSSTTEFNNQLIIISGDPIPSLLIECLRNCGGKNFKSNTREIFYFRVRHSQYTLKKNGSIYNWTYAINTGGFSGLSQIRQIEETPNHILIVNENSLANNQKYTFKVVGGGEPPGEAQISIETFKLSDNFSCEINPKSGVAGKTKFFVNCSVAKQAHSHFSLTVTFYDKNDDEKLGRLLGSSHIESIENVILTRGTVAVYATNMYGQYSDSYITVSLSPPEITSTFLDENIEVLKRLSKSQGYDQKISFISALSDILNGNSTLKEKAIEVLLETISKEKPDDLIELELLLYTTQSVICHKTNCKKMFMSESSYTHLSHIVSKTSRKLASELIRTSRINSILTSSKVDFLYRTLLKCAGVLLSMQNERIIKKLIHNTVDYNIYELYKLGNLEVMKSLNRVKLGLAIKNLPFIKHSTVETEYIESWMKEDIPTFFTKGTKEDSTGSFVKISAKLAMSLSADFSSIVVQAMRFKSNPYWWSQTGRVKTEVMSVNIGYKMGYKNYTQINSFNYPVDIFLKKYSDEFTTVAGNVTQLDPKADTDFNDLHVAVHKLVPPKGAMISIQFTDLSEKDAFRVSVQLNRRPDYDDVILGFNITHLSASLNLQKEVTNDEDNIYIAILPGPHVSIGENKYYKIQVQSARCQVWYGVLWSTTGCKLGAESTKEYIHCQCYHLSSIAGYLGVPMNTVDPFNDYKLFLDLPNNPYVFALVLTILLVFILLLIWSVKADWGDTQKTSIILLDDNISSDQFGYIVTILTGSRLCAGTSSNIGIILHGKDAASRSHILRSTKRTTLERNSDDWFLIYTPKHLGTLSSVQMWTDHSGPAPNWFCDKIYVHDLSLEKDYTFFVGKWFGVTLMGTRVELFSRPAKLDQETHFVDYFITNTVFGFRERHSWVSIFSRHPRSTISRSQRLSMAVLTVLVTLLTSIMFYGAVMPEEDVAAYSVGLQDALISIYSLIISIIVTGVVLLAFHMSSSYRKDPKDKSVKGKHNRSRRDTRIRVDSSYMLKTPRQSDHNASYFFKKAILSMRKDKFYRVQARPNSDSGIVVYKIRRIFAWTLCLVLIFITAYFIILYGLKLGKVKSLLWLTSVGLSCGEDVFLADPCKIMTMSVLFSFVQAQTCDVYAYDPDVYNMRKISYEKKSFSHDKFNHKIRLTHLYKPPSLEKQEIIYKQQTKIVMWWSFIDIVDIFFSIIVVFLFISQAVFGKYGTHALFNRVIYQKINSVDDALSTSIIRNVSSYLLYLQHTLFPALYTTHWYNNQPLTTETEIFADTGWIRDSSHRMMGVPRLRQIRVKKEKCYAPSILKNLSLYCNVLYSPSTEDTNDYGTLWAASTMHDDIIFSKSPWKYLFPEDSSSVEIYAESQQLFHGGGYVTQLERTWRKSADTIWSLMDSGWLDMRTRVVFFEISTYNVNDNMFTSVIFITEHMGSSLILTGKRIWCVSIIDVNYLHQVTYLLYAILGLTKLLMLLNIIGADLFFSSFWPVYDLCLFITGICCFVGYKFTKEISLNYANDFQKAGKDTFFQFQTLVFYLYLEKILLGLMLVLSIIRSLRLLKYGNRFISIKQRYTLYFSWPKILWVTFVLVTFMFSLQRLVAYSINTLYQLGISHFIVYKMNYLYLYSSALSPEKRFFIFLPCFVSNVAMVLYIMILYKSFTLAGNIYERAKFRRSLK